MDGKNSKPRLFTKKLKVFSNQILNSPAMPNFFRTFLFLLLPALAQAQYITHGPVTGAVTPTSARIYLRSLSPASIVLQADSNPAFTNPLSFNGQTIAENDTSAILSLTGLQPGTRYHLRVLVNNQADSLQASFKTFPPEGSRTPLSLAVLSCQEYGTYNTFPSLVRQNPDLVLHTGDWTYPDYQLPGDHRMDTGTLKISYQRRYAEPKMPASLRRSAYDYVVDNHDGIGARTNVSYTWFERDSVSGAIRNLIGNDPTPPGAFENMMYAYQTYFPAYPLYDANDGMYHSYRMGNIEIFFVDVRNCGNEQDSSYRFDSINQVWLWDPKPGQTLLGAKQFNWLLSGLRNSTADWKIIVSGIMFNRAFRKVAQVSLALQGLYFDAGGQSGTGFRLAHSVISNWPGYIREQDSLLNFIQQNQIRDVMVLSGHVHTNVMDDGRNAGLPELNTGPMAGTGPELTYYIDSIMGILNMGTVKDSLWNGGGQGVNNTNFKSGYGKVEIFGNDSARLCIIDEDDQIVSCMILPHSSKAPATAVAAGPACDLLGVYPNPASGEICLSFCEAYKPGSRARYSLIDLSGKIARTFGPLRSESVSVSGLPAGKYVLFLEDGPVFSAAPFLIQR